MNRTLLLLLLALTLPSGCTRLGGFTDEPIPEDDDDDDDATNDSLVTEYDVAGFRLELWVGDSGQDQFDGLVVDRSGVIRSWVGTFSDREDGSRYRGTLSESQLATIAGAFDEAGFFAETGTAPSGPGCGLTLAVGDQAQSVEYAPGSLPSELVPAVEAFNAVVAPFELEWSCD